MTMSNERQNGLVKGSLLMLSVAALFPLAWSETAAQHVSRTEDDEGEDGQHLLDGVQPFE